MKLSVPKGESPVYGGARGTLVINWPSAVDYLPYFILIINPIANITKTRAKIPISPPSGPYAPPVHNSGPEIFTSNIPSKT